MLTKLVFLEQLSLRLCLMMFHVLPHELEAEQLEGDGDVIEADSIEEATERESDSRGRAASTKFYPRTLLLNNKIDCSTKPKFCCTKVDPKDKLIYLQQKLEKLSEQRKFIAESVDKRHRFRRRKRTANQHSQEKFQEQPDDSFTSKDDSIIDKNLMVSNSQYSNTTHGPNHLQCSERDMTPFLKPEFEISSTYDPHKKKKTKLECEIDEAIQSRQYRKAEKLSEELSSREVATKVANACEIRDYFNTEKTKEINKSRKRHKLKWAFGEKQRWESKGNM